MLKKKVTAVAVAAALGAVASLGAVSFANVGSEYSPLAKANAAVPAVTTAAPTRALPDFSQLVDSQGPAVVNISVTQRVRNASNQLPFKPGDPMYEFFRRFQMPMPDAQPAPRHGQGSGFIVSADGYILTNAHVVNGADEVNVKLTDKREFTAKVVGVDKRTDVALLKVDASNLPTVTIGNPSQIKVGEWVAAIGSPFGLDNTVTAGIVSAKSRSLPSENYVPFIQTDVAINPGNSGGPLFNMNGEVIGINSQIYSRTGGYMGLSFSIPIDVAMKVKDDLQKHGKVERGRMGVVIQGMTKDLADSFGRDNANGALVSSVEPGSPAAKAGLQSGDIILSVDGKPIADSVDLPRLVGETRPGQKLSLQVWRKGKTQDLNVTVGRMPDDQVASAAGPDAKPGKLGLVVRPLSTNERKEAGTDGGVVVEQVGEGPAAQAGIRAGDVILSINNEPVKDAEQLKRLVDKSKGNVAVLVQREDAKLYLPLKIG